MKLEISDWKTVPYAEAWDRQTACFDALVHAKQAGEEYVNRIVLCEHPHVYTLGRSGKETNMLLGEEQLRAIGASLYHIDRGGDITYHGPGQLVCYPILNLEEFSLGLKEYVHLLEEAVIRVCASYGITAGRVEKATGVWLDGDSPRARKICAIGAQQPLCNDAWPGAQCQYGFTLFQLYPSLRVHRQRGDFTSKGAGTGSAGRRSETAALP